MGYEYLNLLLRHDFRIIRRKILVKNIYINHKLVCSLSGNIFFLKIMSISVIPLIILKKFLNN